MISYAVMLVLFTIFFLVMIELNNKIKSNINRLSELRLLTDKISSQVSTNITKFKKLEEAYCKSIMMANRNTDSFDKKINNMKKDMISFADLLNRHEDIITQKEKKTQKREKLNIATTISKIIKRTRNEK